MRVEFDDLPGFAGKVAMVDGCFDPLHPGHVAYFRAAEALGLPILCRIAGDAYLSTKHRPLLDLDQRAEVIGALSPIAHVHASDASTAEVLRQLRPAFYVKGADWQDRLPAEEVAVCQEFGIEIRHTDTMLASSSALLARSGQSETADDIARYEAFVLSQRAEAASHYDSHYFIDEWREGANSYSLETRRRIEGRNPELIRDVFEPDTVLDMGCGPGALMYLLDELGVRVDGVDFSEDAKALAPPEVRERISIGSITDATYPDQSHDLVICREVLEHMSVLDIQKAVQNMCRISSRFVYVTTRFHPAPQTLFDVTTEFDVDPSHITLMNMEMLRLMFVLQGFRRRVDLEKRMDWLGKGRVLVYERA